MPSLPPSWYCYCCQSFTGHNINYHQVNSDHKDILFFKLGDIDRCHILIIYSKFKGPKLNYEGLLFEYNVILQMINDLIWCMPPTHIIFKQSSRYLLYMEVTDVIAPGQLLIPQSKMLSIGAGLLNACFILRWATPRGLKALSNSTRGSLCPHLPSPAAAPFKCQHLFSIKRVIVSARVGKKEREIALQPVTFEHMKRNFLPAPLFDWEQWQVKIGTRHQLHMINVRLWSLLWNDCEIMPQWWRGIFSTVL